MATRVLAFLSLCLLSASCQQGRTSVPNPAAPTPAVTPVPTPTPSHRPLYPDGTWTLTSSVTSVTPHRCFRDVTGLSFDYMLAVHRAEAMRLFVYWDPTDGIEYTGALSGQDFSLAGVFNRGDSFSLGCLAGGQMSVVLSGRISGRFSDDGRSMTAEEVITYRIVPAGEQVDIRYRWIATAPAQ
jgi:hypothetical protein